MFRCDILVTRDTSDGPWTFRAVSSKGTDAMLEHWSDLDLTVEKLGFVAMKDVQSVTAYTIVDDMRGDEEVEIAMLKMGDEAAELNARAQRINSLTNEFVTDLSAHFIPLLDKAMAAEDRKAIAKLVWEFPASVEKSFVVDSIRQRFPEIRERKISIEEWAQETSNA